MSLPLQAVDRLFARLSATYGRDFLTKFEGVDPNAVKSSWAHELAGFAPHLESLAWALENLPERCPNVIEFRALARRAPRAEPLQIEAAPASRERVEAELAKLAPIRHKNARVDGRQWARDILARDQYNIANGIKRQTRTVLQMARDALKEPNQMEAA